MVLVECSGVNFVLLLRLRHVKLGQLSGPGSLFLLLLSLSEIQFFVPVPPERGKLILFLSNRTLLTLVPFNLHLPTLLNSPRHATPPCLLLSILLLRPNFSLLHLLIQLVMLLILNSPQLHNLLINKRLANRLFLNKALLFSFLLHQVSGSLFHGKFFNTFLF